LPRSRTTKINLLPFLLKPLIQGIILSVIQNRWRNIIGTLLCLTVLPQSSALAATAPAHEKATAHELALVSMPRQPVLFAEPLVRTAPTAATEDQALSAALAAYAQRTNPDDVSSLTKFLTQYPYSGWAPALLTNLGLTYFHDGNFALAITAWQQAWALGKNASDPYAHALVDRAVGELARTYATFGQIDNLKALFVEIGKRPITGSATEAIQDAREELTFVQRDHKHPFNCGPVALKLLMLAQNPHDHKGDLLLFFPSGTNGTNLAELQQIGGKLGFATQMVVRKPGEPVPMPSIVHWKVGHFATVVGETNGRYHVEDPAFPGGSLWVTPAALDANASGYFLVPASTALRTGWSKVTSSTASHVWGRGDTNGVQPGDAGDPLASGGPNGCPMCSYGIKAATVGLTLSDQPVGYTPPIGPAPKIVITYNQREDSQPANFSSYNVSQKWTLNWLTYITDDPINPGANVSRYLPGGGAYNYIGYNSTTGSFATDSSDNSILVLVSTNPVVYQRLLPNGSVDVYAASDGNTAFPRHIFLSQVIDPQGNALTLNYDGQMRLVSLSDATGRQTTFSYNVPAQPLLVSQVTDPFGRSATFKYDSAGRLISITDILGLTSSFTYDANSLVDAMTTPYGTTNFAYTAPGTAGPPRFLDITDPLGYHEREEWVEPGPNIPDGDPTATVPTGMPVSLTNEFLEFRDSFHWDKSAYIHAGCTLTGGCDYTQAVDWHFCHMPNTSFKSTTIESIKNPLENRIWLNYPGQTAGFSAGNFNQPSATGRVLDDGTTQLSQTAYSSTSFFKPTQTIDPLGRTTSFAYINQIDLSAVTQTTRPGASTTIAQFSYNYQHRPLSYVNAAGQLTHYTYNAAGQLTSVTNPLNQTTTYNYDATGDLTSIVNANGATSASFTYDAYDRVATYTDSEGWTVSYNYDAANRITKITYLDGTSDNYTYNRLDLTSYQDRLGRIWTYTYNADRQLTASTDPVGQQTLFAYNPDGQLTSRTDPNDNVTQWTYDIEGRLITKTYADNSTVTYTYENTTSRLASVLDALSQTKQYSYDEDNELTGVTYLNAVNPTPNVGFTYDTHFPRLVSMTDGTGTTQYSYVPVGTPGALQLQQETPPLANSSIAYAYDALGRVNSRTVAGAGPETFQYDALSRLVSDTNDLGTFTLAYLGQTDQITSRQLANSTLATTWTYLPNSGDRRLSGTSTTGLSAGQSTGFQFNTDAEDQITATTETSDNTIAYPPSSTQQTASYNNLNQLTTLENPPPSSQTLTYDADGNLLSDGTHDFIWDAENRLVGITYPNQPAQATSFTYDGLGRRIAITSTPAGGGTAVTSDDIWCGGEPCQVRNNSGTVTRSYYAEGEFIPGSPSESEYYAPDQLGSVRRVFTATQAPSYDYDTYGNPLQTTAPLTDFGYAGMVNNADSGLDLTWHRVYDPVIGRWLSRDPLGETTDPEGNLYPYTGNDPINLVDPYGLISQGQAAALIALTEIAGAGPEDPAADAISAAIEEDALADAATAEAEDATAAEESEAAQCLAAQGEGAAAEDAGARGLGNLGGIFSGSENAAGGTVYTSDGLISQNDFAGLVNSGMYSGNGEVNIISGVHGALDGSTTIDQSLFDADVVRFGNLPGVNVYNFPEMSPGEISGLLNGPGTTIGGFCFSCAVLDK
jgi:RHS repeat-associated protein